MIDYIRIMRIIIYFILSTPIPVDEQSFIKNNSIIYIDTPIIKHIALNYNIINIILFIIVCCFTFSTLIFMLISIAASDFEKTKDKILAYTGLLLSGLIAFASTYASLNLTNTHNALTENAKLKYNNEITVSYQLETANTLPNNDLTSDDILKFTEFYQETFYEDRYDKPEYNKGNLYSLPILTLLTDTNIKSIKSLYENIEYLDAYYDNNYIEDERYHWINVQLNAFYNSNPVDNTNIAILKNLKN